MKIDRKSKVDILEESEPDTETAYCRFCMINFNMKHPLGPRLDYNERDADMWRQCYECWRIFPIYEVKYEGKLTGLIEAEDTNNPFEQTKSAIVGLSNRDQRPTQKDRLRKKIQEEHDPDVKALLRQGIIIEDDFKYNYQEE